MNNFILEHNENNKLLINIGFVLSVIRYHYEHNEDKVKEYCHFLMKKLNEIGENELAEYIAAQLDEIPTFSPQ